MATSGSLPRSSGCLLRGNCQSRSPGGKVGHFVSDFAGDPRRGKVGHLPSRAIDRFTRTDHEASQTAVMKRWPASARDAWRKINAPFGKEFLEPSKHEMASSRTCFTALLAGVASVSCATDHGPWTTRGTPLGQRPSAPLHKNRSTRLASFVSLRT